MTYKLPLNQVKAKLVESGKIDAVTLEQKIKAKISELSGLISEEGAAHIIANELGVNVTPDVQNTRLKIKDLAPQMNGVEILAKVAQIWEMREFSKNDYSGKVQSMLIADDTNRTKFTLWNDQVDHFKGTKEGDTILIKGIYVKENNGRVEAHLGKGGTFEINPEGETLEVNIQPGFQRKDLKDLTGGEMGVEVLGTIVQVFDPRFFHVHPETGKRIRDDDPSDVEPALSYVMNAIVDDGTSNIRCVFWKQQVNMLLNCDEAKMHEYYQDLSLFEDEKTDLLGEQFVVRGSVKHNEMFDRLEFNVRTIAKADPETEVTNVQNKAAKQEGLTANSELSNNEPKTEISAPKSTVESETPETAKPLDSLDSVETVPGAVSASETQAKEKEMSPEGQDTTQTEDNEPPKVEEEMIQ